MRTTSHSSVSDRATQEDTIGQDLLSKYLALAGFTFSDSAGGQELRPTEELSNPSGRRRRHLQCHEERYASSSFSQLIAPRQGGIEYRRWHLVSCRRKPYFDATYLCTCPIL
jgi:hypothetical protein